MSSSDVVIRVEGLGKKYTLQHQQAEGYRALRDVIAESAKAAGRRLNPFSLAGQLQRASRQGPEVSMHPREEEFWALKDVSFEIRRGERVGIIGRNGAGKSTLLKILSRITEPTTGRVEICGRVASLLEVGTGFHPELTGRENIYLNGAILGMTRREIRHKFDEIVAFAEVERFLDTPVKRFSSGMYVRLAFAVAAHLEPEILVVDEVLAVGDAAFQKKCLGKMEDVADQEGRTVLFVSHNMAAITKLCSQAILLEKGILKCLAKSDHAIKQYINATEGLSGYSDLEEFNHRKGDASILFKWVKVSKHADERECQHFSIGEDVCINFCIESKSLVSSIKIAVEIKNSGGINICNVIDVDSGFQINTIDGARVYSVCFEDIRLYPDTYHVSLWISGTESIDPYDYVQDCLSFDVVDGGRLTMRTLPSSAGIFFFTPKWVELLL
jgi:lipopolysaccharide transport system ATP-binding protein